MEHTTTSQQVPAPTTSAPGVKDKAAQGARQLLDKAEAEARSRINAGQKDAALTLSSVASTLLSSSSQLRDEQQELAGEYIGKAAEQIDRLASYIQSADPQEVVHNVEQFARRRPAVFIGAAFALGVIGARFLRSSRPSPRDGGTGGVADREVPTPRAIEGPARTPGFEGGM